MQVFLDVGSLARACRTHQQAMLVAAHQLVYEEGVAYCVHSRHDDVGVLSISWDGCGVHELCPRDPFVPGLVKCEAIHSFAVWKDLCELDWCRLQRQAICQVQLPLSRPIPSGMDGDKHGLIHTYLTSRVSAGAGRP